LLRPQFSRAGRAVQRTGALAMDALAASQRSRTAKTFHVEHPGSRPSVPGMSWADQTGGRQGLPIAIGSARGRPYPGQAQPAMCGRLSFGSRGRPGSSIEAASLQRVRPGARRSHLVDREAPRVRRDGCPGLKTFTPPSSSPAPGCRLVASGLQVFHVEHLAGCLNQSAALAVPRPRICVSRPPPTANRDGQLSFGGHRWSTVVGWGILVRRPRVARLRPLVGTARLPARRVGQEPWHRHALPTWQLPGLTRARPLRRLQRLQAAPRAAWLTGASA
jgi:hypothetical protein